MTLYLGSHINRRDLHGRIIQQASQVCLGGSDGPHATHVFVCLASPWMPALLRLDGDVPRATFTAWKGDTDHEHALWEVPMAACAQDRFFDLAIELPAYDGLEIAAEVVRTAGKVLADVAAAFHLPRFPVPDPRDVIKSAMICTRLANEVLGVTTPTLFPQELVRHAQREGWRKTTAKEVLG